MKAWYKYSGFQLPTITLNFSINLTFEQPWIWMSLKLKEFHNHSVDNIDSSEPQSEEREWGKLANPQKFNHVLPTLALAFKKACLPLPVIL